MTKPNLTPSHFPATDLVTEDWTASYADPIQLEAGETIELDGRFDLWDGHRWRWAKSKSSKEGWTPDSILSDGDPVTVTEDYSALELTCQKGEILEGQRWLHGWVFCKNSKGQTGWVPDRNLKRQGS